MVCVVFFPDLKNNAKVRNTDRRFLINLVKVDPTMKSMLFRMNDLQVKEYGPLRPGVAGVINTLAFYDAYALAVVNGKEFSPPLNDISLREEEKSDSFCVNPAEVDSKINELRTNLRSIDVCDTSLDIEKVLDVLSNNLHILMKEVKIKENYREDAKLQESIAAFIHEEEKDREKEVKVRKFVD